MTQPAASPDEVVLGPGAYGDPANAGLTREQYEAQEHPEQGPNNPSSDPVTVTAPSDVSVAESEPSPTDPSPTEPTVGAPSASASPAAPAAQ